MRLSEVLTAIERYSVDIDENVGNYRLTDYVKKFLQEQYKGQQSSPVVGIKRYIEEEYQVEKEGGFELFISTLVGSMPVDLLTNVRAEVDDTEVSFFVESVETCYVVDGERGKIIALPIARKVRLLFPVRKGATIKITATAYMVSLEMIASLHSAE